jgi:hypothetical protein
MQGKYFRYELGCLPSDLLVRNTLFIIKFHEANSRFTSKNLY